MKTRLVLLALALVLNIAAATPVLRSEPYADLGAALGFQIHRFEANLGKDEVLVVHEEVTRGGSTMEFEHIFSGREVHASYQVVLVDSGALNPKFQGTYVLKVAGQNDAIEGAMLSHSASSLDELEFTFTTLLTNKVVEKRKWKAAVESYADASKRWPDLPRPKSGELTGSRFLVKKTP